MYSFIPFFFFFPDGKSVVAVRLGSVSGGTASDLSDRCDDASREGTFSSGVRFRPGRAMGDERIDEWHEFNSEGDLEIEDQERSLIAERQS